MRARLPKRPASLASFLGSRPPPYPARHRVCRRTRRSGARTFAGGVAGNSGPGYPHENPRPRAPPPPARVPARGHRSAQPPPGAQAAQPPSRPNQRGRGERSARPAGHASRSGGTGQATRRGVEAAGAEAHAGLGARTASRRGLSPLRVEGADGLTPPPRARCLVPAPAGLYHRAVPPGLLPPPLPSVPPPPGSAVGWPRPGAETQKELGAILGGTKQRRNTLPGDGILRTPVYPVP